MTIDAGVLGPVFAAAVTALLASSLTYFSVRRAKSGRINSTEADTLWDESTAIRRELREKVHELEQHLDALSAETSSLRTLNAELKLEVLTLRSENAGLKIEIDGLRAENVQLRDTQKAQAKENGHSI